MIVKIQNRRGQYVDFDPSKLLPGEFAIVQTGDPNTADGKAIYIGVTAGNVKQIATLDELQAEVETALNEALPQAVDDATARAEAAAESAEQSALLLTIDNTLTQHGQVPDSYMAGRIVVISNSEPQEVSNRLWIKESSEEIEIPTMSEFNELSGRLDAIVPGLTDNAKTALLNCFEHVALWDDGQGSSYIEQLRTALNTDTTYPHLSVVYNPGTTTIYDDDDVEDLRDYLTVRYYRASDDYDTVTEYTLSGNLTNATSIITVTYSGLSKSVSVSVIVGQQLTIDDIVSSIGYTNLTITDGSIDYDTPETFSCLVLNSGIKRIKYTASNVSTLNDNTIRVAFWRLFGTDGTSCYCTDGTNCFVFTLGDGKYSATKDNTLATMSPDPSNIDGLNETINNVEQDVRLKDGVLSTTVDGVLRTSVTNATVIGFWASAATSSQQKPTNVEVYYG